MHTFFRGPLPCIAKLVTQAPRVQAACACLALPYIAAAAAWANNLTAPAPGCSGCFFNIAVAHSIVCCDSVQLDTVPMAATYKRLKQEQQELANLDAGAAAGAPPPVEKKKNKQRVLVLASRGITQRYRHLMEDVLTLLPHSVKESKFDQVGAALKRRRVWLPSRR